MTPLCSEPQWARSLTDAALLEESSPGILRRGKTYASSGAVEITAEDAEPSPAVHARVHGTQVYSTDVWIEDGSVAGSCDCPSADDGWFCKHQVAVALIWRDRLSGIETAIDDSARRKVEASTKRTQTLEQKRISLRDFLHARKASELAARLLELAGRHREIERELQQWRQLTDGSDQPADWKRLVTEILAPGTDFLSWNECRAYVGRASAVLPLLKRARESNPEGAVALCLHAMRRVWAALSQADDSDGEIGNLSTAIAAEWVGSIRAAGPRPSSFGDSYLQIQLDDPFGCFDADAVEQAMGDAAIGRFRRALAERWRKSKDEVLRARAAREAETSRRSGKIRTEYFRDASTQDADRQLFPLEDLYLEQLQKVGDIDTALAVLREDLSRPSDYVRVTLFLEEHDRLREAFLNAEQACKVFPDDWRLQDDLLEYYERDGWTEEALALRRRQFNEQPSVEHFQAVMKAGRAAGREVESLREELMHWLEERERLDLLESQKSSSVDIFRRRGQRSDALNVSLRAGVFCAERRWVEACDLVQPPAVCNPGLLAQIARHLGPAHAGEAVVLLRRVFDGAMTKASSPYSDELELVREIAERLDAEQRTIWLRALRTTYRAKRNFVRDLPSC